MAWPLAMACVCFPEGLPVIQVEVDDLHGSQSSERS